MASCVVGERAQYTSIAATCHKSRTAREGRTEQRVDCKRRILDENLFHFAAIVLLSFLLTRGFPNIYTQIHARAFLPRLLNVVHSHIDGQYHAGDVEPCVRWEVVFSATSLSMVYKLLVETLEVDDRTLREKLSVVVPPENILIDLGSEILKDVGAQEGSGR